MGGTDEKQNEYKSLRTRREPATAPAWALSWGIEMAKARELELQKEPDGGSNAESGSSNPVTKSAPRQWKKGK